MSVLIMLQNVTDSKNNFPVSPIPFVTASSLGSILSMLPASLSTLLENVLTFKGNFLLKQVHHVYQGFRQA